VKTVVGDPQRACAGEHTLKEEPPEHGLKNTGKEPPCNRSEKVKRKVFGRHSPHARNGRGEGKPSALFGEGKTVNNPGKSLCHGWRNRRHYFGFDNIHILKTEKKTWQRSGLHKEQTRRWKRRRMTRDEGAL